MVSQVVSLGAQALLLWVIARYFTVENFGVYAATVALCSLLQLALTLQLNLRASRARTSEEMSEIAADASAASVVVTIALLALSLADRVSGVWSGSSLVVLLYIPAAALSPYIDYLIGAAASTGSAVGASVGRWLVPVARVGFVATAPFLFQASAGALALADSAAAATAVVALWLVLRAQDLPMGARPALRRWLVALRDGTPLIVAAGAWVVIQRLDVLVMSLVGIDPADIGEYQVALRFAEVLLALHSAYLLGFLPAVSSDLGPENVRRHFRAVGLAGAPLFAAVVVFLAVFGNDIVSAVLGEEFAPGAIVMAVLMGGVAAHVLTGPGGLTLMASRNDRPLLRVAVSVMALNGFLNVILVPQLGALGAALATTTSLVALNVGYLFAVVRDSPTLRGPVGSVLKSGASFATTAATVAVGFRLAGAPMWSAVVVGPMIVVGVGAMSPPVRSAARHVFVNRGEPHREENH